MPFSSFCSLHLYGFLWKNNNVPFKPIMQSQWKFVSFELIQIAGSGIGKLVMPNVSAQDRGPFWFSYILNEILQYIEIRNEFEV